MVSNPVIYGPRTPFVHSRTPLLTPRCLSPPTQQHICFSKYTLAHRRREGKIAVKRNAVSELPVPPRQSEGWDSFSKYTCASRPWNGFPPGNPVKLRDHTHETKRRGASNCALNYTDALPSTCELIWAVKEGNAVSGSTPFQAPRRFRLPVPP